MSLGKHISGHTVDDEGHSLMDLVTLCNLSCKCGMTDKRCVSCTPYKMKILNLVKKILDNKGIRNLTLREYYDLVVTDIAYVYNNQIIDICYVCDKSVQYIEILINEHGQMVRYMLRGTVIEIDGFPYEGIPSHISHFVATLKYNELKELSDYIELICSTSI